MEQGLRPFGAGARGVAVVFLLVAGAAAGAHAAQPGGAGAPGPQVQQYPDPTPGWDTAASNPGNANFYLPTYPIAFVKSPVVEWTQVMCKLGTQCSSGTGCGGTIYPNATVGSYHIGTDVLSANNPVAGNELWIYLPSVGQVVKLFPRPIHQPPVIDFTPDVGAVVEPSVSEDGRRIYFAYFQDATVGHSTQYDEMALSLSGADLYAIDISPLLTQPLTNPDTLVVTRLTTRTYMSQCTNPPGPAYQQCPADRDKAAMNPTVAGSTTFSKTNYGTVFMHPTEFRTRAGLRLAYVSNDRRLANSNFQMGRANNNFTLHVAPIRSDGTIGPEDGLFQYYTTTSALSPTPLRNGLAFSYQASTDGHRNWQIQKMDSEGYWGPVIGYGSNPELYHLTTFCVTNDNGVYKDKLVAARYYNGNDEGFGALWSQDLSILGKNTYDNLVQNDWYLPAQVGSQLLTDPPGISLSSDYPSPQVQGTGPYYGKFTSPRCGGVDELYFSYTPTSANGNHYDSECNKSRYRARIDFRPNLEFFNVGERFPSGSAIVIRKANGDSNLVWPTPVVPWSTRSHGDTTQQVASTSLIKPGSDILPGEPFARLGTGALWNTDRRPWECYIKQPTVGPARYFNPWGVFDVNQEHDFITQNQAPWTYVNVDPQHPYDFCIPPPASQILGLAINITSDNTNLNDSKKGYTADGADYSPGHYGQTTEAVRLLGIYDVRNQEDQSVLALIPSNLSVELHAIDSTYGMKLTDQASWHSLKPRETRTDCGGCHQHKYGEISVPFDNTYASRNPPLDLVRSTTTISYDAHCQVQADPPTRDAAVDYPEWRADIWPQMDHYCGGCHNSQSGNGTGNDALSWPNDTQAAGDQVYATVAALQYAGSGLGALGSPLFWAARGRRTDNRDNNSVPAHYSCGCDNVPFRFGHYYSSIHDTLGLAAHPCTTGDAAYAAWVFKLGTWIDNHMPRDVDDSPLHYKFDWYHPTADLALSTSTCAATQIRVGWWDDSNAIKSISVLLDDNINAPVYSVQWPDAQHPIRNGETLISLPSVSPTDWLTVEVHDAQDNRQISRKRIDQLIAECTPGP